MVSLDGLQFHQSGFHYGKGCTPQDKNAQRDKTCQMPAAPACCSCPQLCRPTRKASSLSTENMNYSSCVTWQGDRSSCPMEDLRVSFWLMLWILVNCHSLSWLPWWTLFWGTLMDAHLVPSSIFCQTEAVKEDRCPHTLESGFGDLWREKQWALDHLTPRPRL